MRRFSKRFRTPRPSPGSRESTSRQSPNQESHKVPGDDERPTLQTHQSTTTTNNALCAVTHSIPLDAIADELSAISSRIDQLKGLINSNRSTFAQMTEIKHGLRNAHRVVEHFQMTQCRAVSEEIEALAQETTRHSWQSYKSAVILEERLKRLQSDDDSVREVVDEDQVSRAGSIREHAAGVYVPTGAQKPRSSMRRESCRELRRPSSTFHSDKQQYTIPETLAADDDMTSIASGSTMRTVRGAQYVARRTSFASTVSSEASDTNSAPFPQPREEVTRRIQEEEANSRFTLNEPDRVRLGSCEGPSIAAMVMTGYKDEALILPNLYYIKLHELRALMAWMIETEGVARSSSMSCVEKVLQCVQLLQTGCRYESIAVMFSRSPRQVQESCLEVMGALLRLHSETVNKAGGQEMYMPLWKIWRKFEATEGRAGLYYGFRWIEVAKVLVTLNLYIGRWRMQGMFATDGPTFVWGRFFVSRDSKAVEAARSVEERDGRVAVVAVVAQDDDESERSSTATVAGVGD